MKKVLALILSLIMIVAAVPMNAFAEDASLQIITEANISFDTDQLVGKTREDLFDILSVNTPGLELNRDSLRIDGSADNNRVLEYASIYSLSFRLYPAEGYTLSTDVPTLQKATIVEGRRSLRPHDQNTTAPTVNVRHIGPGSDEECMSVSFSFKPTGPMNVVDTINVSFDNELYGKTTADYKDFITVNTQGVELGDEKFWACIGYPSTPGCEYVETFEPGETYHSTIYIYPKDGYAFSTQVSVKIDGAAAQIVSCEYDYTNESTWDNCNYVKVLLRYRVPEIESEPELSFFEKIFKSISDFFTSISLSFVEFFVYLSELFK